jgi:mRNA-degrading endonuclease toxin of MazEF toxin-antitoxin module
MLRGEIWVGVWPNDPEKKMRPLLIVSNNLRNKAPGLLDILVVKLTSLRRRDGSVKPVNDFEDLVLKFKKDTIIRCAAIYAVEKKFLKKKIAELSLAQMSGIDARLRTVLSL